MSLHLKLILTIAVACAIGLGALTPARAQLPYIGEVRLAGFNFAPVGWLPCDGSLLPIAVYDTLFQLIGTTFGGDGQTTFAVPDLRGRIVNHRGQGPELGARTIGNVGGTEQVTLSTNQLPAHTHQAKATSNQANALSPAVNVAAAKSRPPLYQPAGGATANLNPAAIEASGGNQPHDNMMPVLTTNLIEVNPRLCRGDSKSLTYA